MKPIKSVAVYCSSSSDVEQSYKDAAKELGYLLADRGIELVYGGSNQGLMGIVASAVLEKKGKVYGVIPHFLDAKEGSYEGITELHYVESMHERKHKMFERADAFVILPGGLGTMDETFELLTWKQIGLHRKYVMVLDIDHYWAPVFKDFFNAMADKKFIRSEDCNLFTLLERVADLHPFLTNETNNQQDYVSKWG